MHLNGLLAQKLLIPMDLKQTDHLKAYGVAFWALERGLDVEWLLNYRGGSFFIARDDRIIRQCRIRGVHYQVLSGAEAAPVRAILKPLDR